MRANVHMIISLGILVFMMLMITAAIIDMRRGGSLDDLTPDQIKEAVDGALG